MKRRMQDKAALEVIVNGVYWIHVMLFIEESKLLASKLDAQVFIYIYIQERVDN